MHYDPTKDQSERFGWKKVSEECQPTEEEQRRWGFYGLIVSLKVSVVALLVLE